MPSERIVEFEDIGVKIGRWQQDLKNIYISTAPDTFSWDRLDDAIGQFNAAGIAFSLVAQNAADFMTLSYNNATMNGTLSAIGQTILAYVNNDCAIWQLVLGGTFSSGTQVVVEYSTDGFSWSPAQAITSAGTYYGDATGQYFVRARCAALHAGDSVSGTLICNEGLFFNTQNIQAGNTTVTDNAANNSTMFELVFTGTFSAGTQLEIDYSPDGSTYTTFQTINGPGPITVFGAFPTGYHFLKVKKITLQSGDSINIATTTAGPIGSSNAKNYMDPNFLLIFLEAFTHRYTLGDPQNHNGLHAECVEIYNEGPDDSANDILKTPYFMVQALLACYGPIKAINPNMRVLPGAHLKLVKQHIQTWHQAGYLFGWAPVCNGTNGHYYPGQNPPTFSNPPGQSLDVTFDGYWQAVQEIDIANGYGQDSSGRWKKPFHITEFGWPHGLEDNFTVDTSSGYVSTFNTGGSLGTWSDNFSAGVLTGSGGSKAVYYNTSNVPGVFRDGYVEVDTDWSEQSGCGTRWVDANNSYICLINDASSATNPNTVKVIARASGVETVIGSASIAFIRGVKHTIHFETDGNAGTAITVLFDGVQVISIPSDTTGPQVAGNAFLYQNAGKLQCETFRMVQSGQVTYAQQAANLVYCYEHGRASNGYVVELDWFTQSSANSFSTSTFKNGILTKFPAYTAWQAEIQAYPDWGDGSGFPTISRRINPVLPGVSRRIGTTLPATTRRTGNFPAISRRESS